MPRRKALALVDPSEIPLNEKQHQVIDLLLTGKSITEAADEVGISRRAVTYWLHDAIGLFRMEYERRRIELRQEFRQRIAKLHDLALSALESSLSEDAPPAVRFQAAKFLYESHISTYANMKPARDADDLIENEVEQAKAREHFQKWDAHYIDAIPDDR